jgi:hypothetical protein
MQWVNWTIAASMVVVGLILMLFEPIFWFVAFIVYAAGVAIFGAR